MSMSCLRNVLLMSLCAGILVSACSGTRFAADYAVSGRLDIGGEGRWDYLTYDSALNRLYVPRTTHTLVLDADSGDIVNDILANQGAHGVALVPEAGRGFISNGQSGSVTIFDMHTNRTLGAITVADDADCIIYDPASHKVMAFCGDAKAMVALSPDIDAQHGHADPPLDLGGKPEYAVSDGHGHVYVNIVDHNEIVVIDSKVMAITARWPTAPGRRPTSLALDATAGVLFCGCRSGLLLALSTRTGLVDSSIAIGTGVDATCAWNGQVFASCGDGTLAIAHYDSSGQLSLIQTIATAFGARTMALDRIHDRLFLPTADFPRAAIQAAGHPATRPTPIPGTFKLIVVSRGKT
jgi:DNA-binding beta-propeller fold protein YncE